jgi:hypothetical protein
MHFAYITALKSILVGGLDVLEYTLFNPKVYHIHNFPDIVPYMKQGNFAAFVSGFAVSWWLYIPLAILYYFMSTYLNHQNLPTINNLVFWLTCISFGGLILFMMYDTIICNARGSFSDPYLYHKLFYLVLFITEVIVIGSLLGILIAQHFMNGV